MAASTVKPRLTFQLFLLSLLINRLGNDFPGPSKNYKAPLKATCKVVCEGCVRKALKGKRFYAEHFLKKQL